MFRLRAPDNSTLRALIDRSASASPTYAEIGATRDKQLPDGYKRDRYVTGLGPDSFVRASAALRAWKAHYGAGVDVYPRNAALAVGTNVIVTAHAGPLYALAPCRIVYVIDEPDRFGFAYGTLPDHPECGEEAFILEHDPNTENTTFSIVVFSKPAALAARIGRPIARTIQRRVTHEYLDGLRACVRSDT